MTSTFNTITANSDIYNKYDTNIELIVGEIIMFPKVYNKSSLSNNIELLLCNGGSYSTSDYSELYSIIGNNYDSTTTTGYFNIPDMDERVIKSYDSINDSTLTTKYGGNSTISSNQFVHTHNISYTIGGSVNQTLSARFTHLYNHEVSSFANINSSTNDGRYNGTNVAANGHSHPIYNKSITNTITSTSTTHSLVTNISSDIINDAAFGVQLNSAYGENTSNQQSYIPKSSKIAFYIVAKI